MDKLQPARLALTPDGIPISAAGGPLPPAAYGNPALVRHVFMGGNHLPGRWQDRDRFVVLATGFGLGLNFLSTWQAWRNDPLRCRRLHFVAIESHPFTVADLASAHAAWPEFAALARALQEHWPPLTPGIHRLHLDAGQVILTLVFGDTGTQLRALDAAADAFYLDDLPPGQPPETWTPALCHTLARLAAPGATLACGNTDEQLGAALRSAEFDTETHLGAAGQAPILTARFRSRRPNRHAPPAERRAIVIGAGIAGSTAAHALAGAGWRVTVLEQADAPATGASANLAGVLRPLPSADDNRLSRLTRAGYLATRALLEQLPAVRWDACGVMHLGREPVHEAQQRRAVEQLGWPPEVLQFINRDEASRRLGWPVDTGGWWFPNGGWVRPSSLCQAALATFPERIVVRYGTAVERLNRVSAGWQALAADGTVIAEAPVLVMASGHAAPRFEQFAWLPQRAARGQVSHLPAGATPDLPHVVCKLGYAMPAIDNLRLIGATLQSGDQDTALRAIDHQENLARLNLSLPGFAQGVDPSTLGGRVGFRPMSPDRLPIVGQLPDPTAAAPNARLHNLPRQPGLWCVQGYGARGIVWSALMADLLVSRLEGEPLPLENDLVDAVDPGRFLLAPRRRAIPSGDNA